MLTANRYSKRWRPCAAVFAAMLALVIAGCSSSNSSSSGGSQSSATGGGTATSSAAATTGITATGTPVKIGYLCLCGGLGAADAQISMPAFTAWVKWTNAHGGINGHPVELITRDDPGNPGVALSEARQLVSAGVVALVERDSDDDAAWASYIQSTGVPVFNTTSGSAALAMSPDAFFDTGNQAIQAMTAAFSKYAPGLTTSPNYSDVAVTQWATGLLIAAAAKAGDVGTTRPLSAVALLGGVYALRSTNLDGLTPTLTFIKGQPNVNKCWFYATLRNGRFGTPYGLTPACAR